MYLRTGAAHGAVDRLDGLTLSRRPWWDGAWGIESGDRPQGLVQDHPGYNNLKGSRSSALRDRLRYLFRTMWKSFISRSCQSFDFLYKVHIPQFGRYKLDKEAASNASNSTVIKAALVRYLRNASLITPRSRTRRQINLLCYFAPFDSAILILNCLFFARLKLYIYPESVVFIYSSYILCTSFRETVFI